ncbi:small EDRK-rich factor 1-like isoform 1-T1 [Morphnus guianensis]
MGRRGLIRGVSGGRGDRRFWQPKQWSACWSVSRLAGGGAWPERLVMTRGNQRELARQKNLKKTQEIHKGKRKEDSLSASQRKQRDSEIMQQKQKVANERKSQQAGGK